MILSQQTGRNISRPVGKGKLTGVGVAGEVGAPLNVGAVGVRASSDGVAADGAEHARVGELGGGGDDAVGNGVVDGLDRVSIFLLGEVGTKQPRQSAVVSTTYAVLLLLDLVDAAVGEGPLEDVRLLADVLDDLRLGEGGPELGKVLQLDEVPDLGERRLDDNALEDGGGGGNAGGRHLVVLGWCGMGLLVWSG